MIGRIVPIKDTRTFIMAMSILKDLVPDALAILIGPEEEEPSSASGCRALVSQLGLEQTVQFLGRVPDVTEYLACADVIALTSISEAQPIALLEAAATGLPAVTTDVGSCREIIEGFDEDTVVGRGGIVVEACNPKATAEALAKILLDDALRAEMGRVMQRRIPNLYHKERIRRLYEGMYEELSRMPAPERRDHPTTAPAPVRGGGLASRWPGWFGSRCAVRHA
jgi:glycosyltransferase involved in cell wall biosynthesis